MIYVISGQKEAKKNCVVKGFWGFSLRVYSEQSASLCSSVNSSEMHYILQHSLQENSSTQMCSWEMGCLINLWHNVIELVRI